MKAIFPMGAPSSFQPFKASQYQYNIEGTAPPSYTHAMPAVFTAQQQPAMAMAGTTVVQTMPATEVVTTAPTTVLEVPAKKGKKSKKLSSKKKQKGCC